MEPKNRLAEIFAELGIAEIRFTKEQLEKWGMTTNRFNQLVSNSSRLGMTVGEAKHLAGWLQQHFKGRSAFLFEDDLPRCGGGAGVQQRLPIPA